MWRRKQVEPSVRTFLIFLVGCIALFALCTFLAVLDRNGARPFAVIGAVLSPGFAEPRSSP